MGDAEEKRVALDEWLRDEYRAEVERKAVRGGVPASRKIVSDVLCSHHSTCWIWLLGLR